MFLSHILGDSFSPLLVGVVCFFCIPIDVSTSFQVSDSIRGGQESDHAESLSLLKALYITCFAAVIGSGLFLMATFYIRDDCHKVDIYANKHRSKLGREPMSSESDTEPLVNSDYNAAVNQ